MGVYAAILAAGSGTRFGADKCLLQVRGKPLWKWSFDALIRHPAIDGVGIVCSQANFAAIAPLAEDAEFVCFGGNNRKGSSQAALDAMPPRCDIVLIHDAARPYIDEGAVSRVIESAREIGCAAPYIAAVDTVRELLDSGETTQRDRTRICLMQTPQAARIELLRRAFALEEIGEATDELALIEALGEATKLVEGHPDMLKITYPSDLARFAALLGPPEIRTGFGYDIHRFSRDPDRPLYLGGIAFPGHVGLEGHSDADALLHAIVDALLGAAGLGDIGVHFSNEDSRWKNASSRTFLQYTGDLIRGKGWNVQNVDATLIAETPKIMARAGEIRKAVADSLGVDESRINVKATTNEKLGSLGRGEGIAAQAVATLVQFP